MNETPIKVRQMSYDKQMLSDILRNWGTMRYSESIISMRYDKKKKYLVLKIAREDRQ